MQRDLWKESLNSDGQQFHQYQQNKQSALIVTHRTQKMPWHMTLEIQVYNKYSDNDSTSLFSLNQSSIIF